MIALWLWTACADQPSQGTAVGNPGGTGSLDVVVTDVPEGLGLDVADAAVDGVGLDDCAGAETWIEVGAVLDALPGTGDGVEIPGGRWCGLILSFSAEQTPITLEGETSGGTSFLVGLAPGPLSLEDNFTVDGDSLLLAISLADTLDPAALEAEGDAVEIDPEDERAVAWASAVQQTGSLWRDLDENVDVDDADQLAQLSDGSSGDALSASAGCGCATGGPSSGSGWLVLALLAAIRRRRGPW